MNPQLKELIDNESDRVYPYDDSIDVMEFPEKAGESDGRAMSLQIAFGKGAAYILSEVMPEVIIGMRDFEKRLRRSGNDELLLRLNFMSNEEIYRLFIESPEYKTLIESLKKP